METRFLYLSALELSKFYESRWQEENATEPQRKFKFNEVKWNDESPRTFLSSNRGLVVLGLMHSWSSRDAKFFFFCVGVLFCFPQNSDRVIELSSNVFLAEIKRFVWRSFRNAQSRILNEKRFNSADKS